MYRPGTVCVKGYENNDDQTVAEPVSDSESNVSVIFDEIGNLLLSSDSE